MQTYIGASFQWMVQVCSWMKKSLLALSDDLMSGRFMPVRAR